MPTETNLTPDETLDTTIARAAESWTDDTLKTIVEGLRSQRTLWDTEQTKGTRKRIPSKKIKPAKASVKRLAAGLKRLTL